VLALHLSLLEWAKENGNNKDYYAYYDALKSSNISVFEWLKTQNYQFSDRIHIEALRGNQYSVFKWAIENNCPSNNINWSLMSYRICLDAISRKQLEILQWAVEYGCPLIYTSICAKAASEGRASASFVYFKMVRAS
jgi:hypothetical protein